MKTEYIQAVDAGNVATARLFLSNELLLDPRGASFSEMLRYAVDRLPDLFEPNREAFYTVPPKDEWNEDFMFEVKADLDVNFSKEKLAFYEAVVKYVGKDKAVEIEEEELTPRAEDSQTNKQPTRTIKITKVSGGAAVGGALIATAGLVSGVTVLTVIGCALLVGGLWLIFNDNR